MNTLQSSPITLGAVITTDFSEYADSLGEIFDGQVVQLRREAQPTRCRYVTDGSAVLYEEVLGASSFQHFCLRGERMALTIPNHVAREGRWMGLECPSSGIWFCRGWESVEVMYPAGSENRVGVIDLNRFTALFEDLVGLSVDLAFPRDRYFLHLPRKAVMFLWSRWGELLGDTGTKSMDLAMSLVEPLAEVLYVGWRDGGIGGERRADSFTFRRVSGLLQNGELPNSPAHLACTLGVSLRTLHNACMRGCGHSPGQLLRLHRLNRVRRDLIRFGHSERTVAHLAIEHGFTELGRFSGIYRKVFGELPSETLRLRSKRQELLRIGMV